MKQVADEVWHLDTFFLPNSINAYLIEDVLVDAGTRHSGGKILKQIGSHKVSAHALTHSHPDHQGATHEVCSTLDIPLWVGERDADAAEDPDLIRQRQPGHPWPASTSSSSSAPAIRSTASCTRATRSPASRSSTSPAIPSATSPSGANPTAS